MNFAHRLFPAALAFAGLAVAPTLLAQTDLPRQERMQGSIAYVSGGIGEDEAQAMKQAAAAYPLTLELAAPSGGPRDEYVSDAKLEIRDRQGNAILSTTTEGPLVLIRLPSGTYTVDVAWNGAIKHKTVDVSSGKRQHVVFEFPRERGPQ